jgi:hypothetical protein
LSSSPTQPPSYADKLQLIARGVDRVKRETAPDSKDIAEVVSIEVAKSRAVLDNELLLIGLRKSYGKNIIRFLWWYFAVTCVGLVISAIKPWGIALPEAVQIALVGGTAVSVIGVVGTVAAGLFRPPSS